MQLNSSALKMLIFEMFISEWEKLWAFLIKLKLYIKFNQMKFKSEINKRLFTTFFLKNAAFNWVNLKLHEFLNKTSHKRNTDRESIFSNYKKFKKKLQQVFRVINEKWAAEQHIHVLWQNRLVIKYLTKFQHIAALTEWDDETLMSQYYWELRKAIKD